MDDFIYESTLKDGRTAVFRRPCAVYAAQALDYLNTVGGESDNLMFGKNGFRHLTVQQEAQYIENMNAACNTLMLFGFVDGTLASISQIQGEKPARAAHNFELSVSVAKRYWGLGVGSAAMRIMIDFAREHGARAVNLGVRAGNENAIKLYKRFGFDIIGVRRGYFNIDGVFHDEILMALYF